MKVGDKVKVKSREEILKTLNKDYRCTHPNKDESHINFNDLMFDYTNLIGTISKIANTTGNVQIKFTNQTSLWWWHPFWLELIPEELDIDKDCNPKWLIFCMMFQYLSGNCPNPSIFKYLFTPTKEDGGFTFPDFEYDFLNIQKGNVPFPDWPILNIPLDEAYVILEHCYKYGSSKKDLKFFTKDISTIIFGGFSWSDTPEGDVYWNDRFIYYKEMTLNEKLKIPLTQTDIKYLETQIKTENYENKLQRKKSDLVRGTVPEGNIICGRKRKATVSLGYLSHKVCSGI